LDRSEAVIDRWTLATIVLMALATYLTRITGYLVLGGRELTQRTMTVLDTAPGCVLIAVIAPVFVSERVADLLALALTMAAATRLPLLPTVLIGVGSAGLARFVLG
jgi:uncharacterized membrane protein